MKILLLTTLLISQIASANYERSGFKHWIDEDGDCLDTRHEVLQAQSLLPVAIKNCRVVSGKWISVYNDKMFFKPSKLDIDHIVALKEAWESGANKWTAKQREAFANDYENLIAVENVINREKAAKDPAEWLPPKIEYHCEYIKRWEYVKLKYNLEMDEAEKYAINQVKKDCNL